MFFRLFLIILIVPAIEIGLIIKIGHVIGPLPTVAILLGVSTIGALLAKSQGLRTLVAIRDELAAGRLPAARLLDGTFILAGGILLLTPGFFTDVIGLFFLIPATRNASEKMAGQKAGTFASPWHPDDPPPLTGTPDTTPLEEQTSMSDNANIVILDGYTINPGDNPWTEVEALGHLHHLRPHSA